MEYLALYRKYRPTSFDELIGQDHIVKTLKNQIESGRIGHAYLFTGTRGTGKTTVAKIFARSINCLTPVNGSPCGKCEVCKALDSESNIDVLEIDAASNNGVNEIRDLREKVQYPPVSCKYKVYIIDEVHMLTGSAFNALLKTLEEPPKHAVFILATTEVHKIPQTILSRCMRFDFRLVDTDKISELIKKIYDEIGKEYDDDAVTALAKAGEGSVRDALSIADTALSYSEGKLTYDDVMNILGTSNREILYEFVSKVIDGDVGSVLSIIDNLSKLGKGMGVLIKDITAIVRDMLIVVTCVDANRILSLPKEKFETLKSIADKTDKERLLRIIEIYSDCESNLRYTFNQRAVFETASVKATKPQTDYNIDALLSRITALENAVKNGIKVSENTQVENKPIKEKKEFSALSDGEVFALILSYLRHNGLEMLFNVFQSVSVKKKGNAIIITTQNDGDKEILTKPSNIGSISQALSEYGDIGIEVNALNSNDKLDKIDSESEKLKKIFGDDIVIIKD